MFERNRVFANCTKHHLQEVKEYAHLSLVANSIGMSDVSHPDSEQ
jgi:hypothetical protein